MASAAKPEKPADVRSHILDTGQRLIAARGFSAVGLNEILSGASVPKGSFYHYFASKEAFGSELLEHYFAGYLIDLDALIGDQTIPARERLSAYWRFWRDNQEGDDPEGKCLAVKLGAEVSDISEDMRLALSRGTSAIIGRLSRVVNQGLADGSISSAHDADAIAAALYELWLGASIMAKITLDPVPFDRAMAATDRLLSIG
jgi:TetR/AcrR family transcriptional repressor of nem operon